ncbi:dicarboxylate/amino acid:cation symporter [Pseudoxanthomonas sacheonensis]|uniref:Na+/H+-dicarboxylate symporter n=1 Tax=Pseudoxanthomonas sacheonensis TaxID=443615 RepID=A0ABU1RP23_9GAMM|nr:dicarboxylate/amino acid:cation symporter [Pseudoxanthomonas sacheonensis]MDR6840526.1 Na+/H+-dicarboxylate symporter [Pseudoxanthomonas sacheonensis]
MKPTTRVMLGLAFGAVIGLMLAWSDTSLATKVAATVQPIGKLWLNALQMTVVPLVLSLVIIGVTTASDTASSGRTARRALLVFVILLSFGSFFTALAAPALLSLVPRDPALAQALSGPTEAAAAVAASTSWSSALTAIIPSNAIAAAAQSAMLPLVVFALFFGFALTRIEKPRRDLVVDFFQAIADAMIVIVRWVLWAAPVGVFALVLAVCAQSGLSMVSALGVYILLQCVLYLAVTVMMLPVAVYWGGEGIRKFAAAILPAQVVAASTQSSLASLPAMLEIAQRRLGYSPQVTALVLPMAVSLFRINSPVQYVSAAAFIAWAYGIDLSAAQLATGAALAVIISCGAVGLPGQVSYMATNLPVTQAMGLPIAPLGLLLAVDTIPDVFATVGNVTADLAATSVVATQSGKERPSD